MADQLAEDKTATTDCDRSPVSAVLERLDGMIASFAGVNQMTEQAFLQFGEKVQNCHARSREMSVQIRETLQHLLESEQETISAQLRQLASLCMQWLDENGRGQAQIRGSLAGIDRHVGTFDAPLFGLRKVIKVLHSLRVTTRIEASRSGEAGAQVLSDSLGGLGGMIQEKLDEIRTLIEQLGTMNSLALEADPWSGESLFQQTRQEAAQLETRLAQYQDSREKAGKWNLRLQAHSAQVNHNFEELITALQYQDIIRQRLEHLMANLSDLRERLARVDTVAGEHPVDLTLIGNICALQYNHLRSCADDFSTAIGNLKRNLRQMVDSVTTLTDTTRHFLQSREATWLDNYQRVNTILETIAGEMRITHADQNFSRAALGGVCQAIRQVVSLVDDIEYIGEEMQLLALNAAVSAAHTRMHGSGLTIIAENIHLLSREAIELSENLAKTCQRIDNQAHELSRLESADQTQADVLSDLLSQRECLSDSLRTNAENLEKTSRGIVDAAGGLAHDVLDNLRIADIKEMFDARIGDVLSGLSEYAEWADSDLTAQAVTEADLLQRLESNYTMSSERRVHREFLARVAPDKVSSDADEETEPLGKDHDLGDNVVLF
ncbi:MAG: hypothetical protein RQ723_07265 [Desulfuromonadales bacterium]|nr:hypothetical protein [Desulfuromonadales bacterium]